MAKFIVQMKVNGIPHYVKNANTCTRDRTKAKRYSKDEAISLATILQRIDGIDEAKAFPLTEYQAQLAAQAA